MRELDNAMGFLFDGSSMNVGEERTMGRITVRKRGSDFMAYLDGDESKWESGKTPFEAAEKLKDMRGLNSEESDDSEE